MKEIIMQILNEDKVVEFVVIYSITLLGIIVRNQWDDKVSLGFLKIMTASLMITVLLYNIGENWESKLRHITALFSGFGANNIIHSWIENKIWEKLGKGDDILK